MQQWRVAEGLRWDSPSDAKWQISGEMILERSIYQLAIVLQLEPIYLLA